MENRIRLRFCWRGLWAVGGGEDVGCEMWDAGVRLIKAVKRKWLKGGSRGGDDDAEANQQCGRKRLCTA